MNEATTMCSHDAHDWQPIATWYARYRCSICQVVGCKFGVVVARYRERSTAIEPYRCEARVGGQRCNEPAVHCWHGKKARCAAHPHHGPGKRASRKGTPPCPASPNPEISEVTPRTDEEAPRP